MLTTTAIECIQLEQFSFTFDKFFCCCSPIQFCSSYLFGWLYDHGDYDDDDDGNNSPQGAPSQQQQRWTIDRYLILNIYYRLLHINHHKKRNCNEKIHCSWYSNDGGGCCGE